MLNAADRWRRMKTEKRPLHFAIKRPVVTVEREVSAVVMRLKAKLQKIEG